MLGNIRINETEKMSDRNVSFDKVWPSFYRQHPKKSKVSPVTFHHHTLKKVYLMVAAICSYSYYWQLILKGSGKKGISKFYGIVFMCLQLMFIIWFPNKIMMEIKLKLFLFLSWYYHINIHSTFIWVKGCSVSGSEPYRDVCSPAQGQP